jgi:hypothetical protein
VQYSTLSGENKSPLLSLNLGLDSLGYLWHIAPSSCQPNQPPLTISEQLSQGLNVFGITFTADEGEAWTTNKYRLY